MHKGRKNMRVKKGILSISAEDSLPCMKNYCYLVRPDCSSLEARYTPFTLSRPNL